MKRRLALNILIIFAAMICSVIVSCNKQTDLTQLSSAPPTRPSEIPDDWLLYYDEHEGISFYYPSEWGEVIDYIDYFPKTPMGKELAQMPLAKDQTENLTTRLREAGHCLAFSKLDLEWAANIRITSLPQIQKFVYDTLGSSPQQSQLMLMPLLGWGSSIIFGEYPEFTQQMPQIVKEIAELPADASTEATENISMKMFFLFANGLRISAIPQNIIAPLKTAYGQLATYDGQLSGTIQMGTEGFDTASREFWDCLLVNSDSDRIVYISFSLNLPSYNNWDNPLQWSEGGPPPGQEAMLEEQQAPFKKFVRSITLSAVQGQSAVYTPQQTSKNFFVFPDRNLNNALKAQMLKYQLGAPNSEEITKEELSRIENLDLPGQGIENLDGIENCINLKSLLLTSNRITDVSPLTSLTQLWALHVGGNRISDVTPLAKMSGLSNITLEDNQISDITPLNSLHKMSRLRLSTNQIKDISPLKSMTSLDRLTLSSNQISDISPLASLTKLTYLTIANNTISDISPLASLTGLTELDLANNKISDVSSLKAMTNLTTLTINNNQISDIAPLSSLKGLFSLNLSNNRISNVSSLGSLIVLRHLYLDSNQISDVSSIPALPDFRTLSLSNNNLNNISSLPVLRLLGTLDLSNNQIDDISILSSFKDLYNVNLENNNIDNVTPLSKLTHLKVLSLGHNQIRDISSFSSVKILNVLDLKNNQVSDISVVANMTLLTELNLENNQISDISPVVQNTGLIAKGKVIPVVHLENNSLDLSEGSEDLRNIKLLEQRGVKVYY